MGAGEEGAQAELERSAFIEALPRVLRMAMAGNATTAGEASLEACEGLHCNCTGL